jgi:hypothetical protein
MISPTIVVAAANNNSAPNKRSNARKVDMILLGHNGLKDEITNVAATSFNDSSVRDGPPIHPSCPKQRLEEGETTATVSSPKKEVEQGDILIRGLWGRDTDCIIDVHVTDPDCPSNRKFMTEKVLSKHEREKKNKCLASCADHIPTPTFSSLCTLSQPQINEANYLSRRLATILSAK